ncbi:Na/Pi cotransporter family protein [Sulfurimonas marina]|uniref:Na/Pi cotransporter family protein n=1 Tax=Sulfurimonas marina TaxID=2590551 RepID=A0A7M1AWP9_9BACT|nr:Na/Pi symporter [Sulfurimonas marina]QOP41736.1 Na/Pi cotransporter family protein [Sulfurimonas marina]
MYDIIVALSGLGMFLFGMGYMELALKEFAGIKFKRWLKHSTQTNIKAIFTGGIATALLQSSSVVTLMTLSFVSASLISLEGAIGIIFGANMGTTATAWLVAILGFKVKIEVFALPMIGVGGIVLMFARHYKLIATAKIFVGFGLLFMGLDILKTAIEGFAVGIDLASYKSFPLIAFLALGMVITALIQSSSAATAIILSALSTNILTFEMAAAMAIGTNIGTTATAILGAIGGVSFKKRVAAAHLLFNIITAIIAFIFLSQLSYFILDILQFKNDPVTALALFHTIFNVLGVLLLSPFIDKIANFLNKLFIVRHEVATKYIHMVEPSVAESALIATRNEIAHLFMKCIKFTFFLINVKPSEVLKTDKTAYQIINDATQEYDYDYNSKYEKLKIIEFETIKYLNKISELVLTEKQTGALDTLYSSLRESVYGARTIKDIKHNIDQFTQSDDQKTLYYFNLIRENLIKAIQNALLFENKEISHETIMRNHEEILKENKSFVNKVTRNFEKEGLDEKMVVAFLNSNRSVLLAINSFIDAAKVLELVFEIEVKEEEQTEAQES